MDYLRCGDVRVKIERIKKEIEQLEGLRGGVPKGELLCCKNENRYKWFWKKDGSSTYLPKRNKELAAGRV